MKPSRYFMRDHSMKLIYSNHVTHVCVYRKIPRGIQPKTDFTQTVCPVKARVRSDESVPEQYCC